MSTFCYNQARYEFATQQINWLTGAVNAALVSDQYVPSPTHLTMADIAPVAIIQRDAVLTGLGVVGAGICYGTIPPFNSLNSLNPVVGLVLYLKGASDAVSRLLYYSSDGIGFPFIAVGYNYLVSYDLSQGGFFQV